MKKKKIIFIMPPKDWFYGIDYLHSVRIVKWLKDNDLFDVYEFEDIDIFLKKKLSFKDLLKLIHMYFFFKFKKPRYVFALNAGYIAYCNLIYRKKILNFFSQILNIKCIMKWDHINEQIPNIVENISKKTEFYEIYDYKKFFLKEINNKNFSHYSWQKDNYFCENDYLEKTLDLQSFQLRRLNYSFTYEEKKNDYFRIKNGDKEIALTGYINKISKPKTDLYSMSFLLKNKKNFFNKEYYQKLLDYTNYEYLKNKIDLLKINNVKFYGINTIENSGKVVNANDFYSEISKFFIIINPTNPLSLTITLKFYLIFLYGGFCLNELPSTIPPKLDKFKEYIFYKDIRELTSRIEYLKNNLPTYYSIKQEINEISKNFKNESLENFIEEFKIR